MNANKDCKIVQDLLPNYVENLTDKITNEYIGEHIKKCSECAEKLKNMNGELKLSQINQDKEINYLKKMKKRVITSVILLTALILVVIIFLNGVVQSILFRVDENGKVNYIGQIYSAIFEKTKDYKITFLVIKDIPQNGEPFGTKIFIFDEKNKCIGLKQIIEGFNEEELNKNYNLFKDMESTMAFNVIMVNSKLAYTVSVFNGKSKIEILEELKGTIENSIVEEY